MRAYIYIYIHIHIRAEYIYIYIYVYIERDRYRYTPVYEFAKSVYGDYIDGEYRFANCYLLCDAFSRAPPGRRPCQHPRCSAQFSLAAPRSTLIALAIHPKKEQ